MKSLDRVKERRGKGQATLKTPSIQRKEGNDLEKERMENEDSAGMVSGEMSTKSVDPAVLRVSRETRQ